MARRAASLCLTGNAQRSEDNAKVDGTYTYRAPDLRAPLFPTAEPDRGGVSGKIPFASGTLTDGTETGIRWAWSWHGEQYDSKDVIFDLERDWLVERVEVEPVGALSFFEVSVRTAKETRFRHAGRQQNRASGNSDPSAPAMDGLRTAGRHVCVTLGMGWGRITAIRIWGRELSGTPESQLVAERERPRPRPRRAIAERAPRRSETDYAVRNPDAIGVVPYPRELTKSAGSLQLVSGGAVRLPRDPTATEELSARLLVDALKRNLSLRYRTARGGEHARGDVVLGRAAAPVLERYDVAVDETEGFAIKIDRAEVHAAGTNDAGTLHAAQTIVQLVDRAAERGETTLPCLRIRDWPHQRMRGVHVFCPGPKELPFFKRYVRDVLSRHRLNTIILETAAGIAFDSHPEINEAWSRKAQAMQRDKLRYPGHVHHHEVASGTWISKAQARDLAAWCRKHHIEIIPEIQSLSHCEYLLQAHPEICEAPPENRLTDEQRLRLMGTTGQYYRDVPLAFCPSSKKSYEILFDISEELYDVFEPRRVSIGHDEWREHQMCPRCRTKRGWELFGDDVLKTHAFWKRRGVEIMMWSDHLLESHNGAAKHDWTARCLPRIPRDIVICNWSAGVDPSSVEFFRKEGFRQVLFEYGSYFARPPTLREGFGTAECEGIIATTWLKTDEYHFGVKGSFYSQLFAADNAWTPDRPRVKSREYMNDLARSFERMKRTLRGGPQPSESPRRKRFTPLDLKRFCNTPLRAPGWVDALEDLRHLPTGKVNLAGIPFSIAGKGNAAVVLENPKRRDPDPDLPTEIRDIPVRRKADSLVFLHATDGEDGLTWNYFDLESCRYVVEYADGKRKTFAPRYGMHIHHWKLYHGIDVSTVAHLYGARVAWRGATSAGMHATLYMAEWTNPRPDASIRAVHFLSPRRATTVRPVLFAITAVSLA